MVADARLLYTCLPSVQQRAMPMETTALIMQTRMTDQHPVALELTTA
jgi:hypothetical protein